MIDPGMATLFGGETRAAVLGALANSRTPLTAYRIGQLTGAQLSKVGQELVRLERAALVARASGGRGRQVWVLTDRLLEGLLRRRVRIVLADTWSAEVAERARRARVGPRPQVDLSRFRPTPRLIPNRQEFVRSPDKDRALVAAGLRPSRRSVRAR